MDDTNDGFCVWAVRVTCIFILVLHLYMTMDAINVTGSFTGSTPGAFRQGCVSLDGWDRPYRFRVRPGRR